MEATPFVHGRQRGRRSLAQRVGRFRDKRWQIAQCAVAAGVAWFIAAEVLGHDVPVFAPIAAVLSLGTSYAQRLRRVTEVTAGVAVGVFLGDLLVASVGSGAWQIALVVALAMTAAVLLDAGTLFITQAAVQALFVAALVPGTGDSLVRWSDALVGGVVALVAATVVPSAPLRRPREQAGLVLLKVAELLRAAAEVMTDGDAERGLDLLADARSTDHLVRRLQAAADEGMAVVASSPFRIRHRSGIRRMVDIVDPLDRALRSTRVLVRQVAVGAYRRRPVPSAYAMVASDLADVIDEMAGELGNDDLDQELRAALISIARATSQVERADDMTAEVVLAQLRSVIADLLMLTGLSALEATDAIPPPPR